MYYSDVVTCASMHLKSSVTRLFFHKFVQPDNKDNIKSPYYWLPITPVDAWCGKCFHVNMNIFDLLGMQCSDATSRRFRKETLVLWRILVAASTGFRCTSPRCNCKRNSKWHWHCLQFRHSHHRYRYVEYHRKDRSYNLTVVLITNATSINQFYMMILLINDCIDAAFHNFHLIKVWMRLDKM